MVDEFSAFARMPAPTFKAENLNELVKQSVFLQQIAHPEIDYVTDLLPGDAIMRCDGRQIAQVLTNLLQNGADAIEGRSAAEGGVLPRGRIVAHSSRADDGALLLEILDNGRGLPREQRERLTEPYVTHRVKGTGLGLAIVKKIVEEHGGTLALDDNPTGGACIRLSFPSSIVLSNETGDGSAAESPRQRAGKASYGG
jgi:two-component system nitrogen regulation sensor histidine kinase NtrY